MREYECECLEVGANRSETMQNVEQRPPNESGGGRGISRSDFCFWIEKDTESFVWNVVMAMLT